MGVDISDAEPEQGLAADEIQNFRIGGDVRARQVRQSAQYHFALSQIAQSEFTHNEWMCENPSGVE
jgi:CO/xanthine dehydrogenase FAD-binding subunit